MLMLVSILSKVSFYLSSLGMAVFNKNLTADCTKSIEIVTNKYSRVKPFKVTRKLGVFAHLLAVFIIAPFIILQ